MALFLTPEWIKELDAAARLVQVPGDIELTVQQVVEAGAGSTVEYAIRIAGGSMSVLGGRAQDADVTIAQDRTTAEQIARGELSAQTAFMEGRLRIGGDLRSAVDRALGLARLEDVFESVRHSTTW
ncbi:MAG: SCP2 sterol-binding domain-containing protein [Actinomycetota bacterium]